MKFVAPHTGRRSCRSTLDESPGAGTSVTSRYASPWRGASGGVPIPLVAEQFTMTIINTSSEQIGVYVKVLDKIDDAVGLGDGLVIKGHAGQEATYQDPDRALSGCAAGRRT